MKRIFKYSSLAIAVVLCWFISLFHPLANLHFFMPQGGALLLDQPLKTKELYSDDEVRIEKVYLQRDDETRGKQVLDFINPPRAYLFTFKESDHRFSISYQKWGGTARRNVKSASQFSINSSFYDKEMNSLGEVIVDGKNYGQNSNSSGFFKVINGKAYAGPRSLFENLDGKVRYSCQAHPSVMRDGIIWPYILEESLNQNHWKRRTLRNLSGMDADGNIVFLVSGDGGLLSVKEISELALKLDIETATLFDAGSALQYSFRNERYQLDFSAYNNRFPMDNALSRFFEAQTGRPFFISSPVFINYKEGE